MVLTTKGSQQWTITKVRLKTIVGFQYAGDKIEEKHLGLLQNKNVMYKQCMQKVGLHFWTLL